MDEKFVSVFPNNVKSSFKNFMFDAQKNKVSREISIFSKLKSFLKDQKININTGDVFTGVSSYRDIHYDLPYPFPSNFHIWIKIFLNRRKNILICTEPPIVNPFNYMKIFYAFFIRVYTCNEELVDNKKIFKMLFPKSSSKINTRAKKFQKKKFLVMINSNNLSFFLFKLLSSFGKELYSERIESINFFEKHIPNDFFLYGRGWNKPKRYNLREHIFGFKKYKTYKGEIHNKIELLSNFKYCLCFENLTNVKGYISEKMFDCFKAKCIPIYWGASNIEKYIPKECFIDFRDFNDYEKLLTYISSINEDRYNSYIKNIEELLANKEFTSLWFEDGFEDFFLRDVLDINNDR